MSDVQRADDIRLLERLAEQHEANAVTQRWVADFEPDPALPLMRNRLRQLREGAGREAAHESQMAAFYRRLLSYVQEAP